MKQTLWLILGLKTLKNFNVCTLYELFSILHSFIWLDLNQCKTVKNGWIFQLKTNKKHFNSQLKNANLVQYRKSVRSSILSADKTPGLYLTQLRHYPDWF